MQNEKNKILFINAKDMVTRKNAQSYLEQSHIDFIEDLYMAFADNTGYSAVADIDAIRENGYKLSIPLYVDTKTNHNEGSSFEEALTGWRQCHADVASSYATLIDMLEGNNATV